MSKVANSLGPQEIDFPRSEDQDAFFTLIRVQLNQIPEEKVKLIAQIRAKSAEAAVLIKNIEEWTYLDTAKLHLSNGELDLSQKELEKVEHLSQEKF